MNIKNIVSVAVLLGVASFTTTLSCKPAYDDLFNGSASTSTTTGVGGSGGSDISTTTSVAISTTSGEGFVEVCDPKCPRALPVEGESCDGALDQYCEYAQGACRTARCRVGKNVWEIRDMDPCVCYQPSSSEK